MDLGEGLVTLLVIAAIAALAPLLVGLFPRLHVAQVVVLLVGGILVGPHLLDWGDPAKLSPS